MRGDNGPVRRGLLRSGPRWGDPEQLAAGGQPGRYGARLGGSPVRQHDDHHLLLGRRGDLRRNRIAVVDGAGVPDGFGPHLDQRTGHGLRGAGGSRADAGVGHQQNLGLSGGGGNGGDGGGGGGDGG